MLSVIIVLVCVLLPYLAMLFGIITIFKFRDSKTSKGMIDGLLLVILGGMLLVAFSAFTVHELFKYAPYLIRQN